MLPPDAQGDSPALSIFAPRRIALLLAAVFLGAAAAGAAWMARGGADGSPAFSRPSAPVVESFAAQFKALRAPQPGRFMPAATFAAPGGKEVSWKDFDGPLLLVNFWATWCGPCVKELPSLEKLRAQYEGKGMDVIAISVDMKRGMADLESFLQKLQIGDFALHHDVRGDIRRGLEISRIPVSFLLGPEGQILYIFEGDADWTAPESLVFFDALLAPAGE